MAGEGGRGEGGRGEGKVGEGREEIQTVHLEQSNGHHWDAEQRMRVREVAFRVADHDNTGDDSGGRRRHQAIAMHQVPELLSSLVSRLREERLEACIVAQTRTEDSEWRAKEPAE